VNLRAIWEATNNRWNQWVLNYSQAKQMDLLRNIGFSAPDWQDLSTVLIGLIVTASLAGAGWNWWERQRQDPWLRLLQAARQRLRALGLPVPEDGTPRALANLLQDDARATPEAIAWLMRLEAWRYAKQNGNTADLRILRRELNTLRWLQA
jgi:protein-glutamine gamma-glutamyltransferase